MKKTFIFMITMLMMSVMLAGCGVQEGTTSSQPAETELHISAAASLTDVMKELAADYQKAHPNVEVKFNFGSSGALQQAIENGGEADLFFSAAQKQMDALDKAGELAEGTRKDLLLNEVVLIVPLDNAKGIKSFDDIVTSNVTHIALGEPKGVPVGQYSEEVFKSMHIMDQAAGKAVYASDVRQVLAWVESGEADCGIVYATDAAISDKVKVVAKAPAGSHKPIIYPVAILKGSRHMDAAKDFLAYVSSAEGAALFQKYGFEMK
jgi:molybdate transport system substrate-binding protein